MPPRVVLLFLVLAAAIVSAAPPVSAQDQAQIKTCQGGWEVDPVEKVSACTALVEGKQLKGSDLAAALYLRGSAFVEMGSIDKAIADLSQAIQLEPDASEPYAMRGTAYSDANRVDAAIADFDRAIRLNPADSTFFRKRGDAYESKGMHEPAIADFSESIRLDPKNAFALSTRCRVRAIWGQQLGQALKDCTEAIALSRDNEYAYEQRGLVQLRMGHYADAIADYGEALKKYDGRTESLYGRGIARMRSGDANAGKEDIAAAMHTHPEIAKTFADWGLKP